MSLSPCDVNISGFGSPQSQIIINHKVKKEMTFLLKLDKSRNLAKISEEITRLVCQRNLSFQQIETVLRTNRPQDFYRERCVEKESTL